MKSILGCFKDTHVLFHIPFIIAPYVGMLGENDMGSTDSMGHMLPFSHAYTSVHKSRQSRFDISG